MSTDTKVSESFSLMGRASEEVGSLPFWKKFIAYVNDIYRASAELDVPYVTSSLADGATEVGTTNLGKTFIATKITANRACRVRLYSTTAYRTADASRAVGTDPTGEHGCILDCNIEASNLTLDLSPAAVGGNRESVRSDSIAISITNSSGSTGSVTVTVTRVLIEN